MQVADSSFGGLLEGAPDAMVCVDRRGRIARVNAQTERLFGYQRDELVGEPVEILIPEMVLSARRRDGSTFPTEISLSTIDTDDDLVVIAAVRDVTERLESPGQLAGGVAQDVSNLLAVISNYAAFVGDEVAKDGARSTGSRSARTSGRSSWPPAVRPISPCSQPPAKASRPSRCRSRSQVAARARPC